MTNEELKIKYPLQDDIWPSRRWNKEMTDYVDLSGHESTLLEDIKQLTESEKELLIYYFIKGYSKNTRKNYSIDSSKSLPSVNQLTYRLKVKGFLKQ